MIESPNLTLYYILAIIPFVICVVIGGYFFLGKNKEGIGLFCMFFGVVISICIGIFILNPINDSYVESVINEIKSTPCDKLQSLSEDYVSLKYWYGTKFEDKIQSTYLFNCTGKAEVNE
jgi:hypothetical protein